ncbi:MAG: methionine aminopeptidase [Mariprofundaceae bacterium]|nr:methionine aminopeptidase [Mariprofundaceae bacterium]
MSINVKLSENLIHQARCYAKIQHRSVPKQIEYWSRIGKIAEENPDLPYAMIRDILIADHEEAVGEYEFN